MLFNADFSLTAAGTAFAAVFTTSFALPRDFVFGQFEPNTSDVVVLRNTNPAAPAASASSSTASGTTSTASTEHIGAEIFEDLAPVEPEEFPEAKTLKGVAKSKKLNKEDLQTPLSSLFPLGDSTEKVKAAKAYKAAVLKELSTAAKIAETQDQYTPEKWQEAARTAGLKNSAAIQNALNTKARQDFISNRHQCQPDYSTPCPEGFALIGHSCSAVEYHSTLCDGLFEVPLDARAKASLERTCGVRWPCLQSCGEQSTDWSAPCPAGWFLENEQSEICVAANVAAKSDKCGSRLRVEISPQAGAADGETDGESQRRNAAERCELQWPCKSAANAADFHATPDFDAACPLDWTSLEDGSCEAPANYEGPCPSVASTSGLSVAEKRIFERTCLVRWPSMASSVCVRDYSSRCPLGWQSADEDSNDCVRDVDYQGTFAGDVFPFAAVPVTQRPSLARHLQVDYPCESPRKCVDVDDSVGCPIGYRADGTACVAAVASADCRRLDLNRPGISRETRRELALNCGAEWPCRGEYRWSPASMMLAA